MFSAQNKSSLLLLCPYTFAETEGTDTLISDQIPPKVFRRSSFIRSLAKQPNFANVLCSNKVITNNVQFKRCTVFNFVDRYSKVSVTPSVVITIYIK